jgi:two-component system, cell cycle response regulator DivK
VGAGAFCQTPWRAGSFSPQGTAGSPHFFRQCEAAHLHSMHIGLAKPDRNRIVPRPREAGVAKRILVVEDHEDNRQIVRDLLTNAGFEMIEAEDGEKGVAAAICERPDLILMDMQLPVLDGYEATRRIKANPDLKVVPIIAVTSYALSGDEAKVIAAGCDAYMPKPYSPRVLLAKIKEFLR